MATDPNETKPAYSPAGAGRALRSDARRNRDAVLKAAQALFAEEGVDGGMPDVARAAGVGVGTVYRHFPTKDHLIAALVAGRFERWAEKVQEGLEMDDPWTAVAELIRFGARIQAEDRALSDVVRSRPEMIEAAALGVGLPELTDRLVKRAQRAGVLRNDLTWEDIALIACGLGPITQIESGPASGRWPRLIEIILDGLRPPGSAELPTPL